MDDARKITKEEAITILYGIRADNLNFDDAYTKDKYYALDMAITALEQEPCEDAISRHAVLETIDSRIEQIKRDANKINKSYSHLSFAEGVHDGYCRLKCDLRILPSVNPQPCEDAISRDAVKELIKCGESTDTYDDVEQLCKWIDALPSVTQKSGKWIVHEKPHGIRYLECPYCNIWYLNEHLIRNSYCPNCGARTIEPQERSEKE